MKIIMGEINQIYRNVYFPCFFFVCLFCSCADEEIVLNPLFIPDSTKDDPIVVFEKGEDGYFAFRIPTIVKTRANTLLAFAEGRKSSLSDTGDIDIVLKRSYDNGLHWESLEIVWDAEDDVCGNPCPFVSSFDDKISLLCCWNKGSDSEQDILNGSSIDTRRVFCLHSIDDGNTWSKPLEITSSVKSECWTWFATGPCHGIQLQIGSHKGRFVLGTNHMVKETQEKHSGIIYSDDNGETWEMGAIVTEEGGNESTVAERYDGSLMLNMRNYNRDVSLCRSYVLSSDQGLTVDKVIYAEELIEPICQGSILTYLRNNTPTSSMFFSNPNSTNTRTNLVLHQSLDGGLTWPYSCSIYKDKCAYSDIVQLDETSLGVLYEYGTISSYDAIGFSRIYLNER